MCTGRIQLAAAALAAVAVVALVVLVVGPGPDPALPANPAAVGDRSNVVVVMTDDQAVGSLGLMPHVEALARRGETFTRAFVTTPECCPSRATYLTGQYAHNHRVLSADPPRGGYPALTDKANILPAWLQQAGYRTGHVGKYLNGYGVADLGSPPTEVPVGWDYWEVPADHTEYQMYGYLLNQNGELHRYGYQAADYQTDVLSDKAAAFLRAEPSGRPFFLSVAPVAPHGEGVLEDFSTVRRDPRPAPRDLGALKDLPTPRPASYARPVHHAPPLIRRHERRTASWLADKGAPRASFLGRSESLLAVDRLVGRLVRILRERGDLRNTYFVFTSDNGYLLGEHGLNGKVLPYEESVRVPLVISGPGVRPGSRTHALVANIDLAPTITRIAGALAERRMDGRSLLPLLHGRRRAIRHELLLEYLGDGRAFQALRTDRYAFQRYRAGGSELYDLQSDPAELHNLAQRHQQAEVRARLAERLRHLAGCVGAACP
jgi:N-acetylglucosamine-6-sulfatase